MHRGILGQLTRFGIVGIAATFVHAGALVILVELLELYPTPANMIAFVCAVAVSYLGNYHWTYASRNNHVASVAKFALVALVAAALNYGIFTVLVDAWGVHYLLALLVVMGSVPFASFAIQRAWVFRASRSTAEGGHQLGPANTRYGLGNWPISGSAKARVIKLGTVALLVNLLAAAALQIPHALSQVGDPVFDLFLHYNWAHEFADNLSHGQLYPRWVFHARLGLGEPTFLFYSPAYFYCVALVSSLGLNTWDSMQLVEVVANALLGWMVYLLLACWIRPWLALTVAVSVVLGPFVAMLHYKWQGFPWASVGLAALGLLAWAVLKPKVDRRWIDPLAVLALGIAVLSHIVTALMAVLAFSVLAVWRALEQSIEARRPILRPLIEWAITVILGIGLSAVYLLPALYYKGLLAEGALDLSRALQGFALPFVTMQVHGLQWFSIQWPISLIGVGLFALGLAFYFTTAHKPHGLRKPWRELLVLAGAAVFFASELSYPFWRLDTPLQYVVVPYRFMSLTFVFAVMAVGIATEQLWSNGRTRLAVVSLGAVILNALFGAALAIEGTYIQGGPLPRALFIDDFTNGDYQARIRAENKIPVCSAGDRACEVMKSHSGPYAGVGEYRLPWTNDGYTTYAIGGLAEECSRQRMKCTQGEKDSGGIRWQVEALSGGYLRLPVFDFPMWQVQINGAQVDHRRDSETGLVMVEIPPGGGEVALEWRASLAERLGRWVSLGILLVLLIVAMRHCKRAAIS